MKKKLLTSVIIMVFFGCTVVDDNTMISFKGNLVDENGNPIQDVKIELVSSDIRTQEELQNFGFYTSSVDKLDVFDITNEEGTFHFFFPRSNLNLALYIDINQNLNFTIENSEESFPVLIIEDSKTLDLNFENLSLTPSE